MIKSVRVASAFLAGATFFISTFSCEEKKEVPTGITGTISENAMVVSAREEASAIGLQIIKNGGNAFDAMMATEMALAVTYPFAGNITIG